MHAQLVRLHLLCFLAISLSRLSHFAKEGYMRLDHSVLSKKKNQVKHAKKFSVELQDMQQVIKTHAKPFFGSKNGLQRQKTQ